MDTMLTKVLFIPKHMDLKISNQGFTLIEIVLILALLAVLAIFALPRFFSVSKEVQITNRDGVVSAVSSGLELVYAREKHYPLVLDEAKAGACGSRNLCFTNVMFQPVQDEAWNKLQTKLYSFQKGETKTCYLYDPGLDKGKFSAIDCPN
ncbi:MAG: prepilin-type N-terminal cleavage/methylation domain-containing protein [Pseudomonadota bacterium]